MQRGAMSRGGQRRWLLARSSLASPAWCLRFLPAVLTSLLLASEPARSQTTFGPGLVTTPITGNNSITVVGSTDLRPPAGSTAVNLGGNADATFDPRLVRPGPITVETVNAPAIIIGAGNQLSINPFAAPFFTTITTTGDNAFGLNVVSQQSRVHDVMLRICHTLFYSIVIDG